MQIDKKKIISFILGSILSLFLVNFGATIIKKFPKENYLGIITTLIGFVLFYISIYASQIKKNEEDIKDHNEKIKKLEETTESDKKILNTLKDLIILERIKKIK